MNKERIERRENKRVFFAMEENVEVILKAGKKLSKSFPGTLLTLSTGGFSLSAAKNRRKHIQEGDVILVAKLPLPGGGEAISEVEAEVKHILSFENMEGITIGCELRQLPGLMRERIERFIDNRIKSESQALLEKERSGMEFTVP
jgi:c-di-GMP-binding flagellar brake protein YcgR